MPVDVPRRTRLATAASTRAPADSATTRPLATTECPDAVREFRPLNRRRSDARMSQFASGRGASRPRSGRSRPRVAHRLKAAVRAGSAASLDEASDSGLVVEGSDCLRTSVRRAACSRCRATGQCPAAPPSAHRARCPRNNALISDAPEDPGVAPLRIRRCRRAVASSTNGCTPCSRSRRLRGRCELLRHSRPRRP